MLAQFISVIKGTRNMLLAIGPGHMTLVSTNERWSSICNVFYVTCVCSGSAGASVVAHSVALPLIEIAFSTLDCSIVPTCGAWGSATAAKRGPLKQSWAGIQHSRDGEPLGVLMQMRNARVNGFFFFSSLGVLPGVLVDTLSLCGGNFCVECVLIVLHKFYIEL